VADHIGPESCAAARKGGVEELTGNARPCIQPRKNLFLRDADAVINSPRLAGFDRHTGE